MSRPWTPHCKELILQRDEHRCIYCGKHASGIDHVIPISEGGLSIPCNGVCCCRSCNSSKRNKLDDRWIIKGLQRLIQHGESLEWISGIRHDPKDELLAEARNVLSDAGFGSSQIDEILL